MCCHFMPSSARAGFASVQRNTRTSFHESERKHSVAAAGKSDDPPLFTCTLASIQLGLSYAVTVEAALGPVCVWADHRTGALVTFP